MAFLYAINPDEITSNNVSSCDDSEHSTMLSRSMSEGCNYRDSWNSSSCSGSAAGIIRCGDSGIFGHERYHHQFSHLGEEENSL